MVPIKGSLDEQLTQKTAAIKAIGGKAGSALSLKNNNVPIICAAAFFMILALFFIRRVMTVGVGAKDSRKNSEADFVDEDQ